MRTLTCRECGTGFEAPGGRGRRRELCDRCVSPHTARQRVAAAPRAPQRDPTALEAFEVELMAIGLSATDDVKEAARQVGLDVTPRRARKLAELAREHHGELVELTSSALGASLRRTVAMAALHLQARLAEVPPTSLPAVVASLSKAMDLVQGGAQSTYHPISIVVQGPDGQSLTVGAGRQADDGDEYPAPKTCH